MNKVFIMQEPIPNGKGWKPDLSPAAQFGPIHFIFGVEDRPYADPKRAMRKALDILKKYEFDPDKDFLCHHNASDPAATWIISSLLTAMGVKEIKYLYWQKSREVGESGYYIPVTISSDLSKI